jgi:6-phosphogluconate dehydrogenase
MSVLKTLHNSGYFYYQQFLSEETVCLLYFFLQVPLLEPGDIIIDGGNSQYTDSQRRAKTLEAKNIQFVGSGVSGGEDGARYGPSLMPGGSEKAW